MAFEAPRGNGGQIRVDHFSVSVKRLEMPKLHAFLEQRGVMFQDYPSGRDTGITDADGIRTQLSPEDGWSFLNTPNFPAEDVLLQGEAHISPHRAGPCSSECRGSRPIRCLLRPVSRPHGRARKRQNLVSGRSVPDRARPDAGGRARRSSSLLYFGRNLRLQ